MPDSPFTCGETVYSTTKLHYWVSTSFDISSLVQKNSQHFMLANTDYNKISIDNYIRERLLTFMLSLSVYVKISLTLIYLEMIAK